MKIKRLVFLFGITALLLGGILGCATAGNAAPVPFGNASGTATGAGPGHGGDVYVTVTMANGFITHISINGPGETPAFAAPVFLTAPGQIIQNNSAQFDAISGSTVTSMAVTEAVQIAIDRIIAGN